LLDAHDPHLARQDPGDYLTALESAVRGALAEAGDVRVVGIGVATTGSTPLPVDAANRPLALDPKWRSHPAAQAWLWKDHTAAREAAAITESARRHAPQYLAPIGGVYSAEWFWAKIWHCLKVAPEVFAAAASWVELADFVPSVLAGVSDARKIPRGVCAAGHKAMYSRAWGGLPAADWLARLDPKLAELRGRLYDEAHAADHAAGNLCAEWAKRLGLTAGIPIAIGAFDAHYGAVGAGIRTGTLVKIIGTSTCDIAIAPTGKKLADVPGICGIVDGSVMPGYFGIEAGQSAVGDLLNWWVERVCGAGDGDQMHAELTREAAALWPGQSGLVALDWNNGNRTILVDQRLTGLLVGQTLSTSRAEVYRALIEATAFGARAIIERLGEYGVPVERVVACGGIAERNELFMQIYADVLGHPMQIAGSAQTPALGAAIAAAVAAGTHESFETAQEKMTSLRSQGFTPNPAARAVYDRLYRIYRELHDVFGGVALSSGDLGTLMKRLLALREETTP
jgi:L-ribulokinase